MHCFSENHLSVRSEKVFPRNWNWIICSEPEIKTYFNRFNEFDAVAAKGKTMLTSVEITRGYF